MSVQGIVFNIQKFSIHDGPGVRTTVFLKGCPLRCRWCSNPESQSFKVQMLYDAKKCVHCGTCVRVCPKQAVRMEESGSVLVNPDRCSSCLACEKSCPGKALTHAGDPKTVEETIEICMQDVDFYEESQGGVTISGGEGMSQPEFTEELVSELKKRGIHTAIETTGYVKEEIFQRLAVQFDLLLFDVKQADREKHRQGTGVYNDLIIRNLRWAKETQLNILPRIPVIPEFNDTLQDAAEIADLLADIGFDKVQLLPFHQMGERKYEFLNREYDMKEKKAYHAEELEEYRKVFLDHQIQAFF